MAKSDSTTPANSKRAFGYVRVSVDEEDGNNASIESQKAEVQRYAAYRGIDLVGVFEEPDTSGRKGKRREFDRMISLACASDHPVDHIITYSLSRFARRLYTQMSADNRLAKAGVSLITVLEGEALDANAKFNRNILGAVNEKYATDASAFTRRDRRHNARLGFWNGGPLPFGYRSVVAVTDGKKDRKRLAVVEDEAAIVRLIYDLALRGVDGQPMGTRLIAAHLNGQGHTLRGSPFRHSNVDGILTREHYVGRYWDRTSPIVDFKAKPEDGIPVDCPQIIEPAVAAAVMARRAASAPRVTPPRVVNSPTLLTGICRCGNPNCGAGLTIRTGKGGRYSYYTCNRRAEAAKACHCKPIRADELDQVVVRGLLDRVLEPNRLKNLLADVLDLSDTADKKRQQDLDRIRRERVQAENKLRRLLDVVAEGLLSTTDKVLAERLADYKASINSLMLTEKNLVRSLSSSSNRIDEQAIRQFGEAIRKRMSENTAMRKAYVRLFVDRVTVDDEQILITGSKAALEATVGQPGSLHAAVPRFDREWCRLQDSNL
ncbi:MAG: recombinase family protein [Tsuneonella sp.]